MTFLNGQSFRISKFLCSLPLRLTVCNSVVATQSLYEPMFALDGIVVVLVASGAVDGSSLLDVCHFSEASHSVENPSQLGMVVPTLHIIDVPLQQLDIVRLGPLHKSLVLQFDKIRGEEDDVSGQDSNAVTVYLINVEVGKYYYAKVHSLPCLQPLSEVASSVLQSGCLTPLGLC